MKNYLVAAAVALVAVSAPVAEALASSPFSQMAGSWRGGGRVTPPGGQPERVRCKVSYRVYAGGNKASQSIQCAGSGYWITATSNLRYTPGNRKIYGTWNARYGDKQKPNQKTGGNVQGDYIGDTISISLISEKYTGGMSVRMTGPRSQRVTINSIAVLDLKR